MTTLYPGDDFVEFSLLSNGDRIRGTLFGRRDDPGRPLLLLAGPDGCARGPWVDAIVEACGEFTSLLSIDLPLCGSRTSEKLSALALDPEHPLARQLHDEIQAQTRDDLNTTVQALRDAADLRPGSLAFVGAGLGLELAHGYCRDSQELKLAVVSQSAPATRSALEQALGERLQVCEEVGALAELLRARLS